jgi:cysteine desulfurase
VPLHTDATQAVGKIPVNVEDLQVDLMSFSAHKMYGPKGSGALYVRRGGARVRLEPLVEGGGQERGLRSGTLNPPGIVGLAKALELCLADVSGEAERLRRLRERLFRGLIESIPEVTLNGPAFDPPDMRLPGNLNCSFAYVDGEALMMSMRDLAVSSGSACTSTNPEPSHVLRALGLSDDLTRASLRFGLGRFNTEEEVDFAVNLLAETVRRLRKLSSLSA